MADIEISESGYMVHFATDNAPNPSPTAAGVRFYPVAPGTFPDQQTAETYLRAHPNDEHFLIDEIHDLEVTSTSGGGGNSGQEVIAEDYSPGTPATPEPGTDMNGQAFNTQSVILN